MTNNFLRFIAVLLPTLSLAIVAHADTFEFVQFTPPPGWVKEVTNDGVVYKRPTGVGAISLYNSYPSNGTAEDEFAKMWRARIEPTLPGSAPKPEVRSESGYSVALGVHSVNAQGTITTVALFTVVGRGKALGVLAFAAGLDVLREVTTSLDTVKLNPSAAATATQSASAIEVDFDVPGGYNSERDGNMILLKPAAMTRATACIYGISPSRPSRGSLEADARAALLEPLPGWQIKSDHHNAMRGTAGGGWPYYWFRTDVQQMSGSSMQYLTAMAMTFPTGQGKVSVVWGFGATGPCTLDDLTFLKLFFSIRPRGSTSDNGKALERELVGLWRDTQSVGLAQYQFASDGRYEYGLGTSTTFGNLETRTGSVGDGRWSLRGSELTLTGRRSGRYRVRIYDEFVGGVWRRAMSLLNEAGSPALNVQYMRIQ